MRISRPSQIYMLGDLSNTAMHLSRLCTLFHLGIFSYGTLRVGDSQRCTVRLARAAYINEALQ
jgi:hypothetical protein